VLAMEGGRCKAVCAQHRWLRSALHSGRKSPVGVLWHAAGDAPVRRVCGLRPKAACGDKLPFFIRNIFYHGPWARRAVHAMADPPREPSSCPRLPFQPATAYPRAGFAITGFASLGLSWIVQDFFGQIDKIDQSWTCRLIDKIKLA
jgi:hypothetical protein